MAHQIIINMTDEQYAALAEAAQEKGQPIEIVAQETLTRQYTRFASASQTYKELFQQMQADGDIVSLPTGEINTVEDTELEQLSQSISPGKSASEMVIEDRGPY